jgi:hypothetical protein
MRLTTLFCRFHRCFLHPGGIWFGSVASLRRSQNARLGPKSLTWRRVSLNCHGARGGVAQLVRASACHAEGRGFEPRRSRHSIENISFFDSEPASPRSAGGQTTTAFGRQPAPGSSRRRHASEGDRLTARGSTGGPDRRLRGGDGRPPDRMAAVVAAGGGNRIWRDQHAHAQHGGNDHGPVLCLARSLGKFVTGSTTPQRQSFRCDRFTRDRAAPAA